MKLAEVFHPGDYLLEELEERGWTLRRLCAESGLPIAALRSVWARKAPVTPEIARGLETAFGAPAETWLNLQRTYDSGKEGGA